MASSNSFRLPLRVAIELLTNRVEQLCHFISENGLQPPRLPHEKETELNKILNTLGLTDMSSNPILFHQIDHEPEKYFGVSRDPVPSLSNASSTIVATPTTKLERPGTNLFVERLGGTEPEMNPSIVREPASTPLNRDPQHTDDSPGSILSSWDLDLGFGTCITPAPPDLQHIFGSLPNGSAGVTEEEMLALPGPTSSDNDSTLVEEGSSTADIEGLIDEVSNRVGSLQISPGGKTHFCGPTSTFNLIDPENLRERSLSRSYSQIGDDHLELNTKVPTELEEHLINLYFCWQDPSFHVVDRKVYEEAKAKHRNMEDTSFYSEALRYAMWVRTWCTGGGGYLTYWTGVHSGVLSKLAFIKTLLPSPSLSWISLEIVPSHSWSLN